MDGYIDTSVFRPHLIPEEYIVWAGRPERISLFSPADLFLVPFSIMWCGFALFWEVQVITHGAPLFFVLWGLPFISIGVYLVFGRFLFRYLALKRTLYAVTNRRVLFLRGNRLDAIDGRNLPPMTVSMKPDGAGSIYFDTPSPYYRMGYWQRGVVNCAIEGVRDVNRVQAAIMGIDKDY